MRLTSFLVLAFVAALARAVANCHKNAPHKVKQRIEGPPHGWLNTGPASPDHHLLLKVALPQPNFPTLEKHLWEVSDPNHERYGAYLSKEETEALLAPHPESLDAVNEWLSSHGIEEEYRYRSSALDWVTIRVPVSLAEEMLHTKYEVYTHSESGESIVRTTSYSLPVGLDGHVELIQPTTMFNRLKPFASTLHWVDSSSPGLSDLTTGTITGPAGNHVHASCNNTITINCLQQLYNAVGYKTNATNGNQIAVTSYLEQYANNNDLQQFFAEQNPEAIGSNYTFVSINGGLNSQSSAAAGTEANLDTQFAYGLTYPTPATLYSTGGSPPYIQDVNTQNDTNEPYLDWLIYVSSQKYLPQTISTSYGDNEQTVPYDYAKRICDGLAALGARGISLLFSSGDGGVGGAFYSASNPPPCLSNDGNNKTLFIPTFPATCPYVTSVGGTKNVPEKAVLFSGGGFSNYFPRPAYQDTFVTKYLSKFAPGKYEGMYNPDGRGFPDVAAQSVNYSIVHQGSDTLIGGTSCAAPTFAAFISMLNDARMSQGKPSLGFLNPWLYQKGYTALNDITDGHNAGCGTQGFDAVTGWDPVTGLGTPDLGKLLKV